MSSIDKQALRKRYSAKPTPKCDICGAKMTIQRMSGSRVTYGCSGAIYDETGCHYAEGRSLADEHYEQSRVTVTDESDPDVLALLDDLEAKDRRLNEILKPHMLLPVLDDMDEDNLRHVIKTVCENYSLLHAKWEAAENRAEDAEKRIAELEATVSEPVAFRSKLKASSAAGWEHWDYTDHRQPDAFELENCFIERLYTAPPAPVSVPDKWTIADAVRFCKETGRQEAGAAMDAWNACRAAMLQGAEPVTKAYKLPMQPLAIDAHGTLRFKENPIVRKLLDYATEHGYGLNEIALDEFEAEDQMQLAQLIGYSLSGYGTLSYVTDESYDRAAAAAPQQEVK